MRRLILAGALAAAVATATGADAIAWSEYCDWDPTVLVVTPAGNIVPVYNSVWTSTPLNVGLPLESYKATRGYDRSGNPVTDVDMAVYVPAGMLFRFQVLDEVTTGALGGGTLLGKTSGWSGQTIHVKFVLDEP